MPDTITVCGVTFSAKHVKSVTLLIDGREVYIGEKDGDRRVRGFCDAVSDIRLDPDD